MSKLSTVFRPLMNIIPGPFRNKYGVTLIAFLLWMVFLDRNSLSTQWSLQRAVNKLEFDKQYYEKAITEVESDKKDLVNNKEKFARERYHMRRADEDVFIIEKR